MHVNALTREVSLKVGPLVVETLLKRYFDRLKAQHGPEMTQLRQDELLYDATFTIVKTFLQQCSFHTVEDVQGFSNTRTPSPPWVHVVRLLVPMSCCDQAAEYLITALGGQDEARKTVGGVKWWQVRGIEGVDAQWIATKKDWEEAKRRHKESEKLKDGKSKEKHAAHHSTADNGAYSEEMDEMRCILYSHGGGYYFGSVDQERYSIQRHARKINGRVFAVNYRLAPQYPFPCALQDLLAAYLFLIRPPPNAAHRPVKPEHIVIAGDSAGGGISLALLQVIRDAGLPLPAGGVLISPWCDLTHSFSSVRNNTATDVIPPYGLCLQKPSTLWPPPSDEMTSKVHASLRSRVRKTLHLDGHHILRMKRSSSSVTSSARSTTSRIPDNASTSQLPPPDTCGGNQQISLIASSGEVLTIDNQVQLYTQNSLLAHPLVSSSLSYLGGLPPLLFIVGDKEVLRDEIVYAAHKAANPARFPVTDDARRLYPSLNGIEKTHGPTKVHLQVYDDAAHVLPVLFPFTTPSKFCYRAIATFCKHVTGMSLENPSSPTLSPQNTFAGFPGPTNSYKRQDSLMTHLFATRRRSAITDDPNSPSIPPEPTAGSTTSPKPPSMKRTLSVKIHAAASAIIGNGTRNPGFDPSDTAPSNHIDSDLPTPSPSQSRTAGQGIVYSETPEYPSWRHGMIRERVSTQGVIRPLEPEEELDAFHVPLDAVGRLSEQLVKRYIDASAFFEKKFARTYKAIEKDRRWNLERATKDIHQHMAQLQAYLLRDEKSAKSSGKSVEEGLKGLSSSWGWAWALDGDERPPPSSIVSRRDTAEARRLARIADKAVLASDDGAVSGNNLWSIVVNFLSASTEKPKLEDQVEGHRKSWFPKLHHHRREEVIAPNERGRPSGFPSV